MFSGIVEDTAVVVAVENLKWIKVYHITVYV